MADTIPDVTAGRPRPSLDLPYVDRVLAQLDAGQPEFLRAFGRHLHWGYWPEPARAAATPADFAEAAERLAFEVCSVAGVADGRRVLDVGCGFGGTLADLDERHRDVDLVGLNVDPRQLGRACANLGPTSRNRVRFLGGDACALPIADASVDVVLAVEAIFHFRDRLAFLREAARVLRPGGRLALTDFVPIRYLHFRSRSHFGPINLRCSESVYRRLASEAGLVPTVVRDVTAQTLPTYRVLRRLERTLPVDVPARAQTRLLEWVSRARLVRYLILVFERPA